MGACKSGRCEESQRSACLKLQFVPCPLLFSYCRPASTLFTQVRRPLKESKVVPTDLNWCVGLVSLLSCALTPLLPRRAKRDRLHAARRTNESGEEEEEEENQSIEPQDPQENQKSVYEYPISRSMQRGREWYHAIAGLNVEANPAIRL